MTKRLCKLISHLQLTSSPAPPVHLAQDKKPRTLQDLFSVEGKVALVTGSTQGIGYAMAEALLIAGASVVINGRTQTKVDDTVKSLLKSTKRDSKFVKGVAADLANSEQAIGLVQEVIKVFGKIDILVNNAGMNIRGKTEEYKAEDWKTVIDLNLHSVFYLTREAGKDMIKRKWGRIINLGSIHSYVSMPGRFAYAGTKGAILSMTKSLSLEWAPYNITVNAICPGIIDTPINTPVLSDPEKLKDVLRQIPLGFVGTPNDLQGLTLLLASEAGRYITGAGILIDGGWTAH